MSFAFVSSSTFFSSAFVFSPQDPLSIASTSPPTSPSSNKIYASPRPTAIPAPIAQPGGPDASAAAAPEAAPPAGDVYEDQGDGWFFRKFPDGTYDQQVYVIKDGVYVPYEDPNA